MEKLKVNMSAPWITFVHEVEALFEQDADVHVRYDSETNELKLLVDAGDKADALSQLLPTEKVFGNVTLKIEVVSANKLLEGLDLLEVAFRGNPALAYTYQANTPLGHVEYAVFQNKVVQFFNDQLDDVNGLKSTLYQEIAKDVFETTGVFYCTDTPGVSKPLGEWP